MIKNQFHIPIWTTEKSLQISVMGDIHVGSSHFDEEGFLRWIEYYKQNPQVKIIFLGDSTENALRSSLGDIYEQTLSPAKQVDYVVEKFYPIKDQILGWCDSNHSNRIYKETSFSSERLIAKELGVNYLGWGAILYITLNEKQLYRIHATHGAGGGTTIGGIANKILQQANNAQADIYLRGHHHTKFVHIEYIEERGELKKRGFAITGAHLNFKSSYAEMAGYRIPAKGCVRIKLYRDNWDFRLSL